MPNLMERASIQASGAVRAIRASARGLHGIFLLLAEEHGEIAALLTRAASTSNAEKRRELWEMAHNELIAHERAETTHVYPALRALVEMGAEQEAAARKLEAAVAYVSTLIIESDEWSRAVSTTAQVFEAHATHEEAAFFTAAQEQLGAARAVEIEGLYIGARRSILHELKMPTDENPADGR